jgi:hypothetical protein
MVTMCECPATVVDVNVALTAVPPDELDADDELDPDDEPDELVDAPDELDPDAPPSVLDVGDGLLLLQSTAATGIKISVVVAAVRNSRRVCMTSSEEPAQQRMCRTLRRAKGAL